MKELEPKEQNREVLVKVDNVSKKFCKSLKRSLWYGLVDIANEMIGRKKNSRLRKKEFWALRNISFELKRGECLGLIGHNGAGKSTLLKILNGLIKPDTGRIEIKGRVGALIELGAGFNPILTGRENVYNNAAVLGFTKEEITAKFDQIIEFAELNDFIDTPVQNYSSGMKVRLGFSVAAQLEPDILIIDEVLAVGDLAFKAKSFNVINTLSKTTAIIFVSHNLPQVSRISTMLLLVNRGVNIYFDDNVAKGIELFYSLSSQEDQFKIDGTDEAEIHQVQFLSQEQVVDSINYLDNLTIRLSFTLSKTIKRASIALAFINRDLQIIAQTYSAQNNFLIDNHGGEKLIIEIDLGKAIMNPDVYSLALRILEGEKGKILAGYDNLAKLRITGDFVGNAAVQLESNWKKV